MTLPPLDSLSLGRQFPKWRFWYPFVGFALALGLSAGSLVTRLSLGAFSWTSVEQELDANAGTYLYVTLATTLVFTLYGVVAGRHVGQLTELSYTDTLTKLHNARALAWRLEAETARASRYREPLTLMLLDLDRLKHVNDRFGHLAGDRALRHVAESIASQLRESDFAARKGGDEFAIIAPSTDEASAWILARRIRERITEATMADNEPPVTVSIGVAAKRTDEPVTAAALLAQADRALYEAKRQGRNRVASGVRRGGSAATATARKG